jgi:uncharacterized phage infection (PIP) family protein YhgE
MNAVDSSLTQRLLKGAKDLIWQEDPAPPQSMSAGRANAHPPQSAQSAQASQAAQAPQSGKASSATQSAAQGASQTGSTANDSALHADAPPAISSMGAELLAVVMNRPTAYSALHDAIVALSDIPMDSATRYRSAFAVLKKTQQRTVEHIVAAMELHLSALDAEVTRFAGQSQSAEQDEIATRLREVAALNQAVAQGEQQITRLRTELEQRITQLQTELQDKTSRAQLLARETEQKKQAILQTKRDFEQAVEQVRQTLSQDKTRIIDFLQ